MISFYEGAITGSEVLLVPENCLEKTGAAVSKKLFDGSFLKCFPLFKSLESEELEVKLLVGCGKLEDLNPIKFSRLAAKSVKEMSGYAKSFTINFSLLLEGLEACPSLKESALWLTAQGTGLAKYKYKGFQSEAKDEEELDIKLFGFSGYKAEDLEGWLSIVEGVRFARDLVNGPGNLTTPAVMEERITALAKSVGLQVEVLDTAALKEKGFGGLLSVGLGAGAEGPLAPRLLTLYWQGDSADKPAAALVGKGVAADTGGYCIKSAGSQEGIKGDMAGCAAVAGALFSLAKNKVKQNVMGVMPICENRIAPDSYIPGDVITTLSGKTVEIKNTDAEGRLILADAISYAVSDKNPSGKGARCVVDIATLTGAVATALGGEITGAMTNNNEYWAQWQSASDFTGELVWLLPSHKPYLEMMKSGIADLRNSAGGPGTILAGLFLQEFTGGTPWIHLDIACTAGGDPSKCEYFSDGASGHGVSTMYKFVSSMK